MTPALDAMVKAMAEELRSQAHDQAENQTGALNIGAGRGILEIRATGAGEATFDLAKVARAAIAAQGGVVEDAFDEGFSAGQDWADDREGKRRDPEDAPGPSEAWDRYRDAILKDRP